MCKHCTALNEEAFLLSLDYNALEEERDNLKAEMERLNAKFNVIKTSSEQFCNAMRYHVNHACPLFSAAYSHYLVLMEIGMLAKRIEEECDD